MPYTLTSYGSGPYSVQIPTPTPTGAGGNALVSDIQVLVDAANALNTAVSTKASSASLTAHTSNTSNPHSTTAAQVGAYSTSQTDTLLAAKAPSSHTHTLSQITDLSSLTVTESQVTGLTTDLAGKAASSHTHNASDINAGTLNVARIPTAIPATSIGTGTVSNTEFGYLNGVTSAIQTQLSGKLSAASNLSDLTNLTSARNHLGLMDMAYQGSSDVNIGGGRISLVATGFNLVDVGGGLAWYGDDIGNWYAYNQDLGEITVTMDHNSGVITANGFMIGNTDLGYGFDGGGGVTASGVTADSITANFDISSGNTMESPYLNVGNTISVADQTNPGIYANITVKDGKFILSYDDSGTTRYKYLDLTGTGVTWVHTTTAP